MIRGVVIEQIPNVSIKIQTRDGNIFVYKMDEIEKISKDLNSSNNYNSSYITYDLKGYRGFVDVGYIFGVGNEYTKENRIELSTTHGYQVNNHFFVGGGTGIHYMTSADTFLLPMFINFKGYLLNRNISPFFDLKAGYTLILSKLTDEDIKGGLYVSPSIGVKFLVTNNIELNTSLGFNFQQIRDVYLNEFMNSNGISLKFGVGF